MTPVGTIKSLKFWRYKAFADEQTLELRPITLLFGYNSAGKSAALRSLPILAAAAAPHTDRVVLPAVFDYASPALRQATFQDLLNFEHRGSAISFALEWESTRFAFSVRSGTFGEGEFISDFEWTGTSNRVAGHLSEDSGLYTHDITINDKASPVGLNFDGLRPNIEGPAEVAQVAADISAALDAFSKSVQWLGGTRTAPARYYRFGPGTRNCIGPDGEGTATALRASFYADDGVATAVSKWLADTCGSELAFTELDRQATQTDDRFAFGLRSHTGANIALSDVGEGIAQAIPVVTLAHQARVGLLGPSPILAIEQPELHLHPRASVRLAEEIILCLQGGSLARHVIETHSESVLIAIQTAIVENRIKSSDVVVYWVAQEFGNSSLVPIEFDELGYPSAGWPSTVFREALDQARKLNALRSR